MAYENKLLLKYYEKVNQIMIYIMRLSLAVHEQKYKEGAGSCIA